MSGSSLGVGPSLAPAAHTAPVLGATPVTASSQAAFQALMAGSPAPAVAATPPAFCDPAGAARMAALAPSASQVPMAPGPESIGRTLAAGDVSIAGWPATAPGAASWAPATSDQTAAVLPVAPASLERADSHFSSFV